VRQISPQVRVAKKNATGLLTKKPSVGAVRQPLAIGLESISPFGDQVGFPCSIAIGAINGAPVAADRLTLSGAT
jgi:hypothetical protein